MTILYATLLAFVPLYERAITLNLRIYQFYGTCSNAVLKQCRLFQTL